MTDEMKRHHHFRFPLIDADDPVAILEARVVEELLATKVSDDARDSSIAWELKHQAGVTQMSRILATKRGMNQEVAAMGGLLHDIYVVVTGSYEDHARRGEPIARTMLDEAGVKDAKTIDQVLAMVAHHSDKDVYGKDPYAELGKDVDVLDCLLYPKAISEYLMTKHWKKVREYLARAQRVWTELSLKPPDFFFILDDFTDEGWLSHSFCVDRDQLAHLQAACESKTLPCPVAVSSRSSRGFMVSTTDSGASWLSKRSGDRNREQVSAEAVDILWPHLAMRQTIPASMASDMGLFRKLDDRD
jgi:hypothetical protein